jgi:diguanylate cyclase (GGDEF)-like protein
MTFATLRRADQGGRSTTYGAAVPLTVDAARSIGLLTAFFDSNGAAARGLAALEGVAAAAAPALESMLAAAEEHDRDVVTQLPTRTAFHHAVARESARARREGAPLSVVLVDVDGFRSLNQHPGPLTADHLLADIAQTIEALRPPESLLYRVGGDAFGLVLPGRTSEQAQEIASQLGPAQLERGVGTAPVHLSTGVAELQSTDDGVALAAKAQAALEETKLARRHPAGDSG